MSAVGKRLPEGWAGLGRQLAIWFGFLACYQVARGLADQRSSQAIPNGERIVDLETHVFPKLYELTFQNFTDQHHVLLKLVSWTYWNSEFTVVGLTLLWVYIWRNDRFIKFRNAILLANLFGLVGYVFMPTAPPRLLPELGFVDTHRDGLVNLMANPYAAMPSLHAADSLIVGIVLVGACRHIWAKAFWAVWPAWVWFAVMATGNHFWADCVAGALVALLAMAIVYRAEISQNFRHDAAPPGHAPTPCWVRSAA